jgi:hypothetical protein
MNQAQFNIYIVNIYKVSSCLKYSDHHDRNSFIVKIILCLLFNLDECPLYIIHTELGQILFVSRGSAREVRDLVTGGTCRVCRSSTWRHSPMWHSLAWTNGAFFSVEARRVGRPRWHFLWCQGGVFSEALKQPPRDREDDFVEDKCAYGE